MQAIYQIRQILAGELAGNEQLKSDVLEQLLMHQPSTELSLSLIQRMNMESESPNPYTKNELGILVSEVEDLQNLTGVMPMSPRRTTSTISLPDYPRALSPGWSEESKGTQDWEMTVSKNQMMSSKDEDLDGQIRSTNHRCHGSAQSNVLENQTQTSAATRPGISLRLSNKTLPLSKDGSDVQLVHQQVSQAQNGTRSSKEN